MCQKAASSDGSAMSPSGSLQTFSSLLEHDRFAPDSGLQELDVSSGVD
jgi:hypothetical protein